MDNKRVEIAGDVSEWLHKLRCQAGLTVRQASVLARVEEGLILNWESGYQIPLPDFLVLVHCYGVKDRVVGDKVALILRQRFVG